MKSPLSWMLQIRRPCSDSDPRLILHLQNIGVRPSCSFVILHLEEFEGSSEGESLVDWLQVAEGEIGGHFTTRICS